MKMNKRNYSIAGLSVIILITLLISILDARQTKSKADSAFFETNISFSDVNNSCYNISKQDDGYFTFDKEGDAPQIYDGAKYFGIYCSESIKAKQEFQGAIIQLDTKEIGSKDSLLIEARGSKDGSLWSEWYAAEENNINADINFYDTFQYIQFQIRIANYTEDSKPQFKISSLKLKKVSSDEKKAYEHKKFTDKLTDNNLQQITLY